MLASAVRASMASTILETAATTTTSTINVWNPATRQLITSITASSPETVDDSVRAAKAAFDSGVWSRAPAHHRAKVLSRLSASLEARVSELAILESQQTGRTLREFKAQLGVYALMPFLPLAIIIHFNTLTTKDTDCTATYVLI